MLTRRSLRSSGVALASVVGPLYAVSAEARAIPDYARGWPEPKPTPFNPVHVLGPKPTDDTQRLVRVLSDDVFDRLRRACPRLVRLTTAEKMGEAVDWVGVKQANTSYTLNSMEVENPLDLERFRLCTDCWVVGLVISPGPGWANAAELFKDARLVGLPWLPEGMVWRAHYLDETTGWAMRALAAYDLTLDQLVMRWDVLYG